MRFELMGAFLDREGDDSFSVYQRALRSTYHSILTCVLALMATTVWKVAYGARSMQEALEFTALFSIMMWVSHTSWDVDRLLSTPLRRAYIAAAISALAWGGAEVGASQGWWALQDILPWWRGALFVTAMAAAALWVGEKILGALRARDDRKSHIMV